MMNSLAGVIVAASVLLRQAPQPSAYEHLKGLEWLVGHAVGEYAISEGWDASATVGTKVVRRSSTRWALNKSLLYIELSETTEGHPTEKWLEIVSWDPQKAAIVHSILSPGSGSGSGVWSQVGDYWQLKWTSQWGASVYSGTSLMRAIGADGFTWQITEATKDGEAIADTPVSRCTKTDTAQASGLPEDYLRFMEKLIGEWTLELTVDGDSMAADCEFVWAPEGHCVEYHGVGATGTPSCSGLGGWDPAKRQAVFTEYWNGGRKNVLHYSAVSPNVLEGTMAGTTADGKATSGKIRAVFTGPNECVFTATQVVEGDKVQPDQKTVFRRK